MIKTLTNYEISVIVKELSQANSILYTDDDTKRFPIKILWKIDGNFQKLQDLSKRIEEAKRKINLSYSTEEKSNETITADGKPIRQVKPEYLQEYQKELNDLYTITNDIEIDTIKLDAVENMNVTPHDFNLIKFMIEKEEVVE